MVMQVGGIFAEPHPVRRFRIALLTSLSGVLIVMMLCVPYWSLSNPSPSWNLYIQLLAASIAILSGRLIPRRLFH